MNESNDANEPLIATAAPRVISVAGWYFGGGILLLRMIEMIVYLLIRPINGRLDDATVVWALGAIALSLFLSVGLFARSAGCRWVVFCLAGIGASYFAVVGFLASQRHPLALWAGFSVGFATLAGWLLVLDLRPNWAKIVAGTVLLLACDVGAVFSHNIFSSAFG